MRIFNPYLRLVRRWRWSLLLAMLIATFLLQPLWSQTRIGQFTNFALYLLIFAGAVYAGRPDTLVARGTAGLLLPLAFALELLDMLGVGGLKAILTGVTLIIVASAMIATFTELVRGNERTSDSLVGAIFGFFLIASVWALLYRSLEGWHAGSFRMAEGGDLDTQFLYFSLVTITTVGYGDILPMTSNARVWAGLEAAVGTLYIAILIGRIVGQLGFGEKRPDPTPDRPAAPTAEKGSVNEP